MPKKTLLILICCLILCSISGSSYIIYNLVFGESNYNKEYIFEIEKSESLSSVINKIIEAKISNNKFFIKLALNYNDNFKKIKYGEFQLPNKISLFEAVKFISTKPNYFHKITIIEGETSDKICDKINNCDYLSGDSLLNIKEGSVLPGTYCFSKNITKTNLVKIMQNNLQEYIQSEIKNKSNLCNLDSHEKIIKLASIIEKESSILEEKQIIAYIYLKRLKNNMRLASCPTVLYKTNKLSLTIKDTKKINDYNTYRIKGLPITPICNPSKESIYAVLHPVKSDYLYFIASGDGKNIFSETFQKHKIKKWNIKKSQNLKH